MAEGGITGSVAGMTVDVAICTFRRPSVTRALASVAEQSLSDDLSLRVIVADNDDTPSARGGVEAVARALGLRLTYVHAPARNISVARNACLAAATGDWLAFLDDDEEAAPGWLQALINCARAEGADAVFGPALAVYPDGAPRWMARGDFHSNRPVRRAGRAETGHSCNALIRRAALPPDLRFRPELGQSGGEDTDFFHRLGRSGARMTICDAAMVTEQVPPHRLRLGWLAERRFAEGRHYAGSAGRSRAALVATGLAKSAVCLTLALPLALRPPRAARMALRGLFHAGVAAGALLPHSRRRAYGGSP